MKTCAKCGYIHLITMVRCASCGHRPVLLDPVRVVIIYHEGCSYVLQEHQLEFAMPEIVDDGDDGDDIEYCIVFTNMERAEMEALGEFDGF